MKRRPIIDLKIQGRSIRLGERTLIMGVLNVTPDSFSDGGRFLDRERAAAHAAEMVSQGADWIDVGGESTRPGSQPIAAQEELRRVLPVIRALRRKMPSVPISIDTTKALVAEEAVRAGAAILNDISGLRFDPRLAEVARRHGTPLILMHLRGRPATMQRLPFARSIGRSLRGGLASSIRRARALGVPRSQLIIDPGMGFGKSRRQNFEILANLEQLRLFKLPILIGTSRKSFVQAIVAGEGLDASRRPAKRPRDYWALTKKALPGQRQGRRPLGRLDLGDSAAVAASILAGGHIVRVHDVAAIVPAARIADAILQAGKWRP
jgi:dihydropteroate synthase